MFLFVLVIIIMLVLLFLTGLIIFIRALILKRNMGCGLFGLCLMIIVVLIIYFRSEIVSYQSENSFIHNFENTTELLYPVSGKIIEKKNEEAFNVLGDYENSAIIEMDSIDYKKLLKDIQSNKNFEIDSIARKDKITPSFLLKKQISANDFDCVYKKKSKDECNLWFHKNKQIVVFVDVNN